MATISLRMKDSLRIAIEDVQDKRLELKNITSNFIDKRFSLALVSSALQNDPCQGVE